MIELKRQQKKMFEEEKSIEKSTRFSAKLKQFQDEMPGNGKNSKGTP